MVVVDCDPHDRQRGRRSRFSTNRLDGVPWMVGAGPVMAIALLLKAVRFEL
jgi:hypothetical protein